MKIMTGNWFFNPVHKQNVQITGIRPDGGVITTGTIKGIYHNTAFSFSGIDALAPIKLNDDVLKRIGFKTNGKYNSADIWESGTPLKLIQGNGYYSLMNYPLTELRKLHELQNLYLSITGEELIINL